jgi:hypothetical protein
VCAKNSKNLMIYQKYLEKNKILILILIFKKIIIPERIEENKLL